MMSVESLPRMRRVVIDEMMLLTRLSSSKSDKTELEIKKWGKKKEGSELTSHTNKQISLLFKRCPFGLVRVSQIAINCDKI